MLWDLKMCVFPAQCALIIDFKLKMQKNMLSCSQKLYEQWLNTLASNRKIYYNQHIS